MASRLESLIQTLLEEQDLKQVAIPEDLAEQEHLYRALQNVRSPAPAKSDFLYQQDRYLQEKLLEKGVVKLADLPPVAPNIYLWQGDITRLAVDVIVNAANSKMLGCFVPNHPCIDNAIHTAAGLQLRLACHELMQEQREDEATGQAKITPGYNLPAKYVLHTVGPIVYGELTDLERDQLRSSYQRCLELASQKGLTSLAFCCISTGEFRFPQEEAAQIAVSTVKNFLKIHKDFQVVFNVFKDEDLRIYKELLGRNSIKQVRTSSLSLNVINGCHKQSSRERMRFKTQKVNGLDIFYREAGDRSKETFVLLHGFPSSSHMFRNLITLLENDFHVIAPDFIGFGQSSAPLHTEFDYTFDNLTEYVEGLLEQLAIERFYLYVFDYGAPIGFRIARKYPERILGIVSQNGNIYQEGLGPKWAERAKYWANPSPELREQYKIAFAPETIYGQYTVGEDISKISPDGYSLDIHYTTTPDYAERQSDLIFDYQTNVALYPAFQQYIRDFQPKLLAAWGKNDPSFIYPGAEAFLKDNPNTRVELLDGGHFVLESHYKEIAVLILEYFK